MLTGVGPLFFKDNDYLDEYINAIKTDEYYFVDSHKFNADGTISQIVISDQINKNEYIDAYK